MTLTAGDFEYVRALVRKDSAIELDSTQGYLVDSRLSGLARELGMPSLTALFEKLRAPGSADLMRRVVERMTTNETSFFRDPHYYDALRTIVLPNLVAARQRERKLSIWSAAASSGQEIYSIAMTVDEVRPPLDGWYVRLLATDLCESMLARCRDGKYRQLEVARGLGAPQLVKFFERDGADWQLKKRLRDMVEFKVMNLAEPWPPVASMDLIFLRNVLIYFSVETKKKILANVRQVLRPDGWLVLGSTESTFGIDDRFERHEIAKAIFYRPKP
ncbi:MAG: protein-glutamate O-methyltransferase CheR [Planctomycetes bacterium]|nr:protein-glutamate O-methyltransferase CheR [Planctomycetota bacterium]MCC7172971.1 protein-glutamate O-methyltransferase CheR [Planctomycetota bacterium]